MQYKPTNRGLAALRLYNIHIIQHVYVYLRLLRNFFWVCGKAFDFDHTPLKLHTSEYTVEEKLTIDRRNNMYTHCKVGSRRVFGAVTAQKPFTA